MWYTYQISAEWAVHIWEGPLWCLEPIWQGSCCPKWPSKWNQSTELTWALEPFGRITAAHQVASSKIRRKISGLPQPSTSPICEASRACLLILWCHMTCSFHSPQSQHSQHGQHHLNTQSSHQYHPYFLTLIGPGIVGLFLNQDSKMELYFWQNYAWM